MQQKVFFQAFKIKKAKEKDKYWFKTIDGQIYNVKPILYPVYFDNKFDAIKFLQENYRIGRIGAIFFENVYTEGATMAEFVEELNDIDDELKEIKGKNINIKRNEEEFAKLSRQREEKINKVLKALRSRRYIKSRLDVFIENINDYIYLNYPVDKTKRKIFDF